MSDKIIKEYIHEYFLTASECNVKQQMPFTMLAQRVIEVATEHANILGVGYDDMIKDKKLTVKAHSMTEIRVRF